MLQYDMRYINMAKKQTRKEVEQFNVEKFISGRKRPVIAVIASALVAWGLGDIWAGLVAGLVVEAGISTAIWIITKK